MPDLSKKLDIVVIGGSLAGLMASIPLKRLGHRVTILERSPTPMLHDQGAGVVAGGETQAFFNRHDFSKRPIAIASKARLYLDKAGEVIHRENYEQRMTSWDLLYNLARANFDGTETKYADPSKLKDDSGHGGEGKYEYGRSVTSIKSVGDKVEVGFNSVGRHSEQEASEGDLQSGTIVADFLIAADGPSSHSRGLLLGSEASERTYVGYVAFRGTVPETQLSESSMEVFVEKFTFFHDQGSQILAYTIPGSNGTLEKGERLVNWVWYWNYKEDSEEFAQLMTDVDGNKHRFTLPTGGKMQQKVWDLQKERASEGLPPQFAEIVLKTSTPFVQAITDVKPPSSATKIARLLDGKAVLIGDALAGFRPHTAASTSQAAYHALLLEMVFRGQMDWEDYESTALNFAWSWQSRGVMLGNRSQFGHHPLVR